MLGVMLLGYVLFNRGWAYLGYPPIFVGELLLFSGLMVLLLSNGWRWALVPTPAILIILLDVWCLAQTLPYIEQYGLDALRDAAIWYYSLFALVVAGLLCNNPERLVHLLRRYRRLAEIVLLLMPVIWTLYNACQDSLPRWPWAEVPILVVKGGDYTVHVAGIICFLAIIETRSVPWKLWMLLPINLALNVTGRSAVLGFLAGVLPVSLLHFRNPRIWGLWLAVLLMVVVLGLSNFRMELDNSSRNVSFEQLAANVSSLWSKSDVGDLDGTKEWRLQFWNTIIGYTLHGPYFWTGKGFGVNLADDDGFQCREDGTLRSPHNSHLTVLARAGVPGLLLWASVQASWAYGMLASLFYAYRDGHPRWAALFLFLLSYWAAFMINASFDVSFEGPMSGIWFWCVVGVGMAATCIYRRRPTLFDGGLEPTLPAPPHTQATE